MPWCALVRRRSRVELRNLELMKLLVDVSAAVDGSIRTVDSLLDV